MRAPRSRTLHIAGAFFLSLSLAGCGGGDSAVANDPSPTPTPAPPTQPDGDCTYVLTENITVPSRLVDTPNLCDYRLEGLVDIKSRLVIEPGVVVRAAKDAYLRIDGGEIQAVGDAANRIVFEGESHVQGFWSGIHFISARESVFDYVDIKDGGQVCDVLFCPDVGFLVDAVTFSMSNSTVSNSYVIGASIDDDVNLKRFENNKFYGNVLSGLSIGIELVPNLDTASDYRGELQPNGIPYVDLGATAEQSSGGRFEWKKLNAPYRLGMVTISGGLTALQPGVEIVMRDEAWLDIEGNGVLRAEGTAEAPVIIRGQTERPGAWVGMQLRNTEDNLLSHTRLLHTGNSDGLIGNFTAVDMEEAKLEIVDSVIADGAGWGVRCDEPTLFSESSELTRGPNVAFQNMGAPEIDSDCFVR